MKCASRRFRHGSFLSCEEFEARRCLSSVSFAPHDILGDDGRASSVFAADFDGDGDVDVLSASYLDGKVAWYENADGNGSFGEQRLITTTAVGKLIDRSVSLYAADVDGDGDVDVLSASSGDNKVAWYENLDGKGNFGEQQVIKAAAAWSVYATDMDGDGDVDVLSASSQEDNITWYENSDGKGTFGDEHVITRAARQPRAVYAADVDNDGDIDVLSASSHSQIAWHENIDGQGAFGEAIAITTAANGASSVHAADVDGDGDLDVLSLGSDYGHGQLAWYENTDGHGAFSDQNVISRDVGAFGHVYLMSLFTSVYAVDIDGNGDVDVLSASYGGLSWYEHLHAQVTAGDSNSDFQFDQQDIVQVLNAARYLTEERATFEEGDWNNDGLFNQLDIIAALRVGNYLQGPYAAAERVFAED